LGDAGVKSLAAQVLWLSSRTHCGALSWDAFRALVPPDCVEGDTVLLVPRSDVRPAPISIRISCGAFFSQAIAEQWRSVCEMGGVAADDAGGGVGEDKAGCDEGVQVRVEVLAESRAVSQRMLDSGAMESAKHAILVRARVVQDFAFPLLLRPLASVRQHLLLARALAGDPVDRHVATERHRDHDLRHQLHRPQPVPVQDGTVIHLHFLPPQL
jgi:hypothetical protein